MKYDKKKMAKYADPKHPMNREQTSRPDVMIAQPTPRPSKKQRMAYHGVLGKFSSK